MQDDNEIEVSAEKEIARTVKKLMWKVDSQASLSKTFLVNRICSQHDI